MSKFTHDFYQDPTHPRKLGHCDYTYPDGDYCCKTLDQHMSEPRWIDFKKQTEHEMYYFTNQIFLNFAREFEKYANSRLHALKWVRDYLPEIVANQIRETASNEYDRYTLENEQIANNIKSKK